MKFYITVLLLLFSYFLFAQPQYIDPVKLTWQDFRGLEKYDSGFMAFTFCKVSMSFDRNFRNRDGMKISIRFYPDSSWVDWQALGKIPRAYADTLFSHELLHYYIGILVFKKLKIAFKKLKFVDLHDEYKNLNEGIRFFSPFADLQKALNTKYDTETMHSANRERQKYWNDYIFRCLDSLKGVIITPSGN